MWISRKKLSALKKRVADLEDKLQSQHIQGIKETTFFINQEPYLTEVFFSMPYHDWCKLQQLPHWAQVVEFLAQTKH